MSHSRSRDSFPGHVNISLEQGSRCGVPEHPLCKVKNTFVHFSILPTVASRSRTCPDTSYVCSTSTSLEDLPLFAASRELSIIWYMVLRSRHFASQSEALQLTPSDTMEDELEPFEASPDRLQAKLGTVVGTERREAMYAPEESVESPPSPSSSLGIHQAGQVPSQWDSTDIPRNDDGVWEPKRINKDCQHLSYCHGVHTQPGLLHFQEILRLTKSGLPQTAFEAGASTTVHQRPE